MAGKTVCLVCETENEPDSLYCRQCGTPLRRVDGGRDMAERMEQLGRQIAELPEAIQGRVVDTMFQFLRMMEEGGMGKDDE